MRTLQRQLYHLAEGYTLHASPYIFRTLIQDPNLNAIHNTPYKASFAAYIYITTPDLFFMILVKKYYPIVKLVF